MPHFDHTGPEGMGSRTGRGRGQCMNRGGKGRMAVQGSRGNPAETAQMPEQATGQNMIQGRCCRHGQGQNNRMRNCGMNDQGAGTGREMGRGMGQNMRQGQGMQKAQGMGRSMATNQPESCGTVPTTGSDGTDNNS
ncbi:DUF5320 domain-containing protein [Desulfovibrio sp.]|uniref:DUF5320 domain-containing protein n=1 Tax=Desulfovibrio sp. TaxID=885 RepID=UPI0035AF69BD